MIDSGIYQTKGVFRIKKGSLQGVKWSHIRAGVQVRYPKDIELVTEAGGSINSGHLDSIPTDGIPDFIGEDILIRDQPSQVWGVPDDLDQRVELDSLYMQLRVASQLDSNVLS